MFQGGLCGRPERPHFREEFAERFWIVADASHQFFFEGFAGGVHIQDADGYADGVGQSADHVRRWIAFPSFDQLHQICHRNLCFCCCNRPGLLEESGECGPFDEHECSLAKSSKLVKSYAEIRAKIEAILDEFLEDK